jgi:hypothetical protein
MEGGDRGGNSTEEKHVQRKRKPTHLTLTGFLMKAIALKIAQRRARLTVWPEMRLDTFPLTSCI